MNGGVLAFALLVTPDPDWHVDEPHEFADARLWTPWRTSAWVIPATVQDISENDADTSHSPAVHRIVEEPARLEMHTDGPVCDWKMHARFHALAFLGLPALRRPPRWMPSDEIDVLIDIRRHGLGLGWIRQRTPIAGWLEFTTQTLASTTPIDDTRVRLVVRHRARRMPSRVLTRLMASNYRRFFNETIEEDVRMWQHKIYRVRPAPSKSDRWILQFRKWSEQFYPPASTSARCGRRPSRPSGCLDTPRDPE